MQRKWDEGSWSSETMLLYHHVQVAGVLRGKQRRDISSLLKAEK